MATNSARRVALLDAAVSLLADAGARGLTFRAIDDRAALPRGTATNYFESRSALVGEVFERIGVRLSPTAERLAELAALPPTKETFGTYMGDLVARVQADPAAALALYELRLFAARDADIAPTVRQWLHTSFAADVEFNDSLGLPTGATEVALFHYAIDGLLLDRLTEPIDPSTSCQEIVALLVDRLVPDVGPSD
jgi:DNA-binding transcriptional regulator YbjK